MIMDTKTLLLCDILSCWYLDIDFLVNLADKNEIEIDINYIVSNYWECNINLVIFDILYQIAEKFIEENKDKIIKILWLKNHDELTEYIEQNDIYEIFTNYFDSHLRFKNDEIQDLLINSKYKV